LTPNLKVLKVKGMSSQEVSIEDARKKLGDLVNAAAIADVVTIITRNGRPLARIAPLEPGTRYQCHTESLNSAGCWETFDIEPCTREEFDESEVNSADIGGKVGEPLRLVLIDPELDGDAAVVAIREINAY
jgi:prevent-host-death family protein